MEAGRPPSKQPDGLGLLDRRNFPEFRQYRLRYDTVHVNDRDGLARLHIPHPASEREVGNVDFVIAQNRADFPDHARYVSVAEVKQITLERGFDLDSIHV